MKHRKRLQPSANIGFLPAVSAGLMAAGLLSNTVLAQVQNAGELFVSVDATKLSEGPLADIKNDGTLAGFFEATGGTGTIPVIATEGGTKGIRFGGTEFLQLVSAVGGSLVNAPAGIVGDDPSRSIEVWALDPSVGSEETMVSWGKRGGPNGSNISFGYGSSSQFGAVGHWGQPDLGWSNDGGNPEANKWHHLVYTFDDVSHTTRVYADGKLANAEILDPGALPTFADTPINIATQVDADGTTPTAGLRLSGTIARVRIHDGVLTPAQIANNYNVEKADFVNPQPAPPAVPERLTKGPIHRYTFSEATNSNATGLKFKDSVGTADGTVLGDGAEFTGTRLRLTTGGASATAAYGDLPNGLVSTNAVANGGSGEFSFETWFQNETSHTWSRIFDFGSSTTDDGTGEVNEPGGGGTGLDYLEYSAQMDNNVNVRRLELRNEDPAGGGVVTTDVPTQAFNTEGHVLVTWKEATGQIAVYENGVQIGGFTTDDKMSDINDVNIWLGRSNWTADQNTQGSFDEARFYNVVLTPGQALGNFLAGPDLINDHDVAVTIATQPANKTIPETLPATFRVDARGSSPVTFQWLRNGTAIAGATSSTYTLASVSAADSGATFSVEVSNTVNGTPVKVTSTAATLTVVSDTVTLKHRYSFNETSGTQVTDSVGAANGTTIGGATFGGGNLTLDGNDGTYVDLPNGIVTALGNNATFEMWVTYAGGPNWARVFDFGISTGGEDLSDGGADVDYLFFTAKTGDGFPRFEANFPNGGVTTVLNHPGSMPLNEQEHIVITYSSTGNAARLYTNGTLVATSTAPLALSALNDRDKNVWLGRSQFPDPFFAGKYNEFRIYQGSMTAAQVAASYAAGPESTAPPPTTAPSLGIQLSGANVVVTWPSDATGFQLEGSPVLGPGAAWTKIGDGTPITNGKFQVTVPIAGAARYLRLKK